MTLAEEPQRTHAADLPWAIERKIVERTFGRIRQLEIESGPERVVVRGTTCSYYHKQLAVAAVTEVMAGQPVSVTLQVDIEVGTSDLRS